jgi:hypothetical protein
VAASGVSPAGRTRGRIDVVTPRSYSSRVRFEWDEANLRKHGIDFAGIEALFEGHTLHV